MLVSPERNLLFVWRQATCWRCATQSLAEVIAQAVGLPCAPPMDCRTVTRRPRACKSGLSGDFELIFGAAKIAFIISVAIPTIAAELHASPVEVESVIAIDFDRLHSARQIVSGGRLKDICATKAAFLAGVGLCAD
jgi:hypothetical protein